jgi:sec-independent protein translocase protein TatB
MFGIGFGEMLIIGVVLLIAVGPRELPKLMKTVGKGMREVRKASNELRKSTGIDELMADDELRNPLKDQKPFRRTLVAADLERELPPQGVDVAHAQHRAEALARVAASAPGAAPGRYAAAAPAGPLDPGGGQGQESS